MLLIVFSLLLALTTSTYGCSCRTLHSQSHVCWPGQFIALMKITNEEVVVSHDGVEEVVSEPVNVLDFPSVRYHFKLKRAYKGINATTDMTGYLRTRYDGAMCGTRLEVNQVYLIFGRQYSQGDFQVDMCNLVIPWGSLSKSERKDTGKYVTKANKACEAGCSVKTCDEWTTNEMCSPESSMECVWTAEMGDVSQFEEGFSNHVCYPNKEENSCEWKVIPPAGHKKAQRHHFDDTM